MSAYPNEKQGGGALQQQQQQPLPQQQPLYPPPGSTFTGPSAAYPGAVDGAPTQFLDPNIPRPNDILPLHPAIIQQRQIAATLPPCPKGGYHELRSR
ncbi:hypothetical protein BGZ94_009057, partial [Podila epigama]